MISDTINDTETMAGGAGTLLAGRYRIVKQLGQGGMGSVWLAEDTQLDNKPFAVKMLPSILVSNKRAYRQLKDEALVAMKLTHPNIVTLRAFEENNGNPFLVMDYIDGETLDDYFADYDNRVERLVSSAPNARTPPPLRGTSPKLGEESGDSNSPSKIEGVRGSMTTSPSSPSKIEGVAAGRESMTSGGLPESEVIRLLRPIAAALDYAHGEGVVHRDVKPANVMIRKDGHPFILDFGIAREIQETMTRVTGKLSSGTLLYMSPEQLRGQPAKPAQDVYSFAAMAYECLKGEPPFSRGQVEYQILNEQPEPLEGYTPLPLRGTPPVSGGELRDSSPETGEVAEGRRGMTIASSVMSGLAKKPGDRPPTCVAVLSGDVSPGVGPRVSRDRDGRADRPPSAENGRAGAPRTPQQPSVDSHNPSSWKASLVAASIALAVLGVLWWKRSQTETSVASAADQFEKCISDAKSERSRRDEEARQERERQERLAKGKREREERESREWAEHSRPKHGDTKVLTLPGGATMEMIYVGPGEFMMGSNGGDNPSDDETTSYGKHKVRITKGFWLGKYEVTQSQWESVMGSNPSYFKSRSRPVETVSWEDCQVFCQKINMRLNCGARLPTEAEWEYACRAGTDTTLPNGENLVVLGDNNGRGLNSIAWYGGNSCVGFELSNGVDCSGWKDREYFGPRAGTHAVGQKAANRWGFHDMIGNVWEWCNEWYGSDYYKNSPSKDPQGPSSGVFRVLRGGGWNSDARFCRSANRSGFYPGNRRNTFGFRLCCSAGPRE